MKRNAHFEEFHLRNIDKWKSAGKSNVCFRVLEVFIVTVKFKTLLLPYATSCKEQTAKSLVFVESIMAVIYSVSGAQLIMYFLWKP